jgi:hypothetical protein
MNANSSLYIGSVMHRRLQPRHHFRYRAFWLSLDLRDLPELARRLRWFSYNAPNIFSLRDQDHGDGSATPLREQIERRLESENIHLEGGRIILFCMPRTLGYVFNPLSIFYCYRADGTLAAVLYEVHNTFGERHVYLMSQGEVAASHTCRKMFYVSPFMEMDLRYDFRICDPGERTSVGIIAKRANRPIFSAVLSGERQGLTDRNLLRVFLRIPAVTLKVIAAIHWEALRLWLKGVPLVPRAHGETPLQKHSPATPKVLD